MRMNGKEVEWEDPPKGDFLTDVKIKVLWRDEKTGAHFRLLKIPLGGASELAHVHPEANQWNFMVSGEAERPDGTKMTASEDNYLFWYIPKGQKHAQQPLRTVKEIIRLQYFDGPSTKISK
jgi:hypothetical protein